MNSSGSSVDTLPAPTFTHFGVLDDGSQSKRSVVTSIVVNLLLLLLIVVIGRTVRAHVISSHRLVTLVAPLPPVKPMVVPKRLPVPPPPVVKSIPLPAVVQHPLPAPPVAPKVAMSAPAPALPAIAPHPIVAAAPVPVPAPIIPITLGKATDAAPTTRQPATTAVSLGVATNGSPHGVSSTQSVNLGRGNGSGHAVTGSIQGVHLGGGGAAPGTATASVSQIQLGRAGSHDATVRPVVAAYPIAAAPKVMYRPTPVYSQEALRLHIEGDIEVRLSVSATGAITVLGVVRGLGHGLDESALQAVRGMQFRPAVDASGQPVGWEGTVKVVFQIAR